MRAAEREFITLNPAQPKTLAAGSNDIFRLPMRGYFSANGGANWGGVDLPLPPPKGSNGIDFGSDPTLAFDTRGNLFYGYIVVFFGNGAGVNGTEMAVARSKDGGKTYPFVTYFSVEGGSNHFNDKPMMTADTNANSPFRDNIYIAWDAAVGGSTGGGIRVGSSSDHGATFNVTRADDPSGPGRSIGTSPAVGPNGQLMSLGTITSRMLLPSIAPWTAAKLGRSKGRSPGKRSHSILVSRLNLFGALWFIPCSMSIAQAGRTGAGSIVPGWIKHRRARPTFICRFPMTRACIGHDARLLPINC
jgi:hypothetical protein